MAFAQNPTSVSDKAFLRTMENHFDQGNFDSLRKEIERRKVSQKLIKKRLLELHIMASLEDDDQEAADSTMRKLLLEFPSYQPGENSKPSLNFTFGRFRRYPLISMGFALGLQQTKPRVFATTPIRLGQAANYQSSYISGIETGVGLRGEVRLGQHLRLGTGLALSYLKHGFFLESLDPASIFTEEMIELTQTHEVSLNLGYVWQFSKGNVAKQVKGDGFHLGVFSGPRLRRFVRVTQSFTHIQARDDANQIEGDTLIASGFLVTSRRNPYNLGWETGFNLEWHWGFGHAFLNYAMMLGLNPTAGQKRWTASGDVPFWNYHIVDDKLTLDNYLMVSAGFMFHLKHGIRQGKK